MKVGVLALQGAFAAHLAMLDSLGVTGVEVRTPAELAGVDRLVMPGGESTTMSMMLERSSMLEPLRDHLASGKPVFGTCAGTILLAGEVVGGRADQVNLAAIDMTVTRNAYGRQRESFEVDLDVEGCDGGGFHAVFIRAPRIEAVGDEVEVLARIEGSAALVRSEGVLASTFHPELSGDNRIHAMFCGMSDQELD